MSANVTVYDYPAIRQWYILQEARPSVRDTATKFGIRAHSTLQKRMKDEEWEVQRLEVIARSRESETTVAAARRTAKMAAIENDLLELVQAAILKMNLDLDDRWETDIKMTSDPESGTMTRVFVRGRPVDARSITLLIDKVLVLRGQPSNVSENREFGVQLHGNLDGAPLDLAREVLRRAEAEGAGAEPLGRSALPRAEAPRQIEGGVAVSVG